MGAIKAIETQYAGCRFRSRLEARWAVFFTTLGIGWEYEPEGFEIGWFNHSEDCDGMDCDGSCHGQRTKYLPDFLLPDTDTWCEVKGRLEDFNWQKMAEAVDWGNGLPNTEDSLGTSRGLLLLGAIPWPRRGLLAQHPLWQHSKGGFVGSAIFRPSGLLCIDSGRGYFDSTWGSMTPGEIEDWWRCTREAWLEPIHDPLKYLTRSELRRVLAAYEAARSARFEHGESGAPRGAKGA